MFLPPPLSSFISQKLNFSSLASNFFVSLPVLPWPQTFRYGDEIFRTLARFGCQWPKLCKKRKSSDLKYLGIFLTGHISREKGYIDVCKELYENSVDKRSWLQARIICWHNEIDKYIIIVQHYKLIDLIFYFHFPLSSFFHLLLV